MPIYTHTYIYIYMSPMKYIDKYIYSVTGQLVRSVARLAARWLSVFVGICPAPSACLFITQPPQPLSSKQSYRQMCT